MDELKVLQKTEELHEGRWWEPVDGGRVHCYLCPRHCRIGEGQAGFCFIRVNRGGRLYSLGYGAPAALQVDPIEKKPLNHFLPGTRVFSMGTAGCNMGCFFCQNWDISKSRADQVRSQPVAPEDVPLLARQYGCDSIAFTYNEPTIWGEYVIDICKAAREHGLKTVMVSNGYTTREAFRDIYEYVDAANIDLKAFTENFYGKITLTHLEPVLETLRWLREKQESSVVTLPGRPEGTPLQNHSPGATSLQDQRPTSPRNERRRATPLQKHEPGEKSQRGQDREAIWFEITNLMIPGLNDDPAETRRLAEWILRELGADVPVHFTAFHPDFKLKDRGRTPAATLDRAREIAREVGLRFVYEGNVFSDGANTICPGCGIALIRRSWHEVVENRIVEGKCFQCGIGIAGRWERGAAQSVKDGERLRRYGHLNL